MRKDIFIENCKFVAAHNELFGKGLTSYELQVFCFADLTFEEFSINKTENVPAK